MEQSAMSFHQLQVFDAVVRHGSLTKASEQRHCVPSALSRHLKAFQEEYGTLLHSNGRGVKVTERGRALYSELDPLLSQLAASLEKYRVLGKTAQAKSLVIGGSRGASKSVLPPLITQFKKAHPTVEIELKAGASPDVEDLALKSEVDLALISDPYPSPSLEMEPFRELKICVFVARHHPLAKRAEIPAEELAQFPIVAGRAKRGQGRFAEFLRRMSAKGSQA
jgi:LysR family nitrogen assimilation transcriptional regulator